MARPAVTSGPWARPHRTLVALTGFSVFLGVVLASCTGVLDLDGYRAAAPELCTLLEHCYGRTGIPGCLHHVESRLETAGEEDRTGWLTRFSAVKCLDSCTHAWLCLDIAPVCQLPGETCTFAEQCCGFTVGFGTCSRQKCCAPNGVPCASNEQCCGSQCIGDVCGGIACTPGGEACANSFECCSGICNFDTGKCAKNSCKLDGFDCTSSSECCSGLCNKDKICGTPPCAKEGDPCSADQCCPGLECNLQNVCAPPGGCTPDNVACSSDTECCSMFCHPDFQLCGNATACAAAGEPCIFPSDCCSHTCGAGGICECLPDGAPCTEEGQCCNANCNGATCGDTCAAVGAACAADTDCCSQSCPGSMCCYPPGCPHDACTEGSPLDAAECDVMGNSCPGTVCAMDPDCCCIKWDAACVDLAKTACGVTCPTSTP